MASTPPGCNSGSPGAGDDAAIVGFTHMLAASDNSTLVRLVISHLGQSYTSRQAIFDLR